LSKRDGRVDRRIFFDTYALIDFFEENPNYKKFEDYKMITTILNVMELHYYFLRTTKIEKFDQIFNKIKHSLANFSIEDIKKSNDLKLEYKKRSISYVDCLGYIIAKREGVKFLTGDKEFEDLSNVEFVK